MAGTVLSSGGTLGDKGDLVFVLCGLVHERDDHQQMNREIKNCEKRH